MSFWAAWQFLTTIPSPCRRDYGLTDVGKGAGFFPVMGLVLGLILLGLDRLLGLFLPPMVANILLIIALILLTGALHLDGFIDTCDSFAVKSSASERLKIMRDSRVGGFAVVGGCCLIVAKFASLSALPEGSRAIALLLMPVLGRWGMVFAISAFPAARREGIGWTVKQGVNQQGIALAALFSVAVALVLLSWWGAVLLAVLSLVLLRACRYLRSLFGGLTGDSYGAINELGEVVVLILMSPISKFGAAGWLAL